MVHTRDLKLHSVTCNKLPGQKWSEMQSCVAALMGAQNNSAAPELELPASDCAISPSTQRCHAGAAVSFTRSSHYVIF